MIDTGGAELCAASCSVSLSCAVETPICDDTSAACRPCTAGEDYLCRDRSPDAPRCVGGRCVACVSPRGVPFEAAECRHGLGPVLSPVCAENACRPCQKHSECGSGVCAKDNGAADIGIPQGSCVPYDQILVVDQELCSSSGPVFCTPAQAFTRLGTGQRYVLIRKSAQASDFSGLTLGDRPMQAAQTVYVIGPLADHPPQQATSLPMAAIGGIATQDGITVSHGSVVLEGLFVQNNRTGIACTGSDAKVQIRRSFFSGNATAITASGGCKLTVAETWIGSGPAGTGFQGLPGNARGIDITGSDFRITNTVFVDDGDYRQDALGGVRVHSLSAGTTRSAIINSTFYQQHGLIKGGLYLTSLLCEGLVGDRLVVLNSLFFGDQALLVSPPEHPIDPACGSGLYSLGSNDMVLTQNGSTVLAATASLFVDAPGRDLRLLSGSQPDRQALSAGGVPSVAVGGELFAAPAVDLDGVARGQGRVAIGAFESVDKPTP